MSRQSGILTVEFLLALVIGMGMSMVLFAMTFTLTAVEVVQYMTFSAARAHSAGHGTVLDQQARARSKFTALSEGKSPLRGLFSTGWFTLGTLEVRSGEGFGESFYDDFKGVNPNRDFFIGVSVPLTANILTMNIPLLGSSDPEDQGFKTHVTTILVREPSQEECQKFWRDDRKTTLKSSVAPGRELFNEQKYVSVEDNGC